DFVLAIDLKSETNKIPWKGYIYEVKQNHILLKFNEGFHPKNQKYQLTFHFSRKTLRKQHHAIELGIKKLPSILFPDNVIDIEKQVDVTLNLDDGDLECGSSILAWFNPSLNVEQKQAVTNILQGVARPTPYIIFGPPGTGKTVTLIEVILQLIRNVPKSRLLVATPSNSSANLLTERIIDSHLLKGDQFVRLVSYINVQRGTISPKVLSQCGIVDISLGGTRRSVNSELETNIFNAKKIMSRQLVIGTCITLGSLMQCELPEDHFTHVIVDESGQCTETESMIPLQFVDKDIGQVILAGDPLQLGPIVLSSIAVRLGLSKSLLTRLLERPLYQQDIERFQHGYDPRLVTKLVKNYRSLPRVMQVYNKLFYDNDLVGMLNGVDSEEAKILRKLSPVLPNHGARHNTEGVCFIGVKGENLKCSESPSWYNMEEAK
ncbi:putative RNA helicase armi, partial [Pseudolycoriella hygida]